MSFYHTAVLLLSGIAITTCTYAQVDPSLQADSVHSAKSVSSKYLDIVSSKAGQLEQKLDKQTAKALQQWQKQEARIKRKLAKTDSLKAATLFGNAEHQYKQLEQKLQSKTSLQQYIPSLDTLNSSLKFLQQNPRLLSNAKGAKEKLSDAIAKVNGMEDKFQKAEEIKQFIKERKQLLNNQLGSLGFAKELKKLNKQAYYYNEQLNEYKFLLKDHKKVERKALELLSKSKLFNNFMRKNSMLASLFRLPGDPDNPVTQASLAGLQTRAMVNNLVQQQIGPNGQAQFRQNVQDAQSQLQKLKDKVTQLGNSNSDGEMPEGFRPNSEKTKTLFQRLEYSANMQSQKATTLFPTRSDIGLSVGYRISDKNVVGAGLSYRIGWGRGWNNIRISHLGMGIRSFWDWKLKGSLWLSTGYEMNYNNEIKNIDELKNKSAWQNSGLAGLSKIVSLRTKFFKKTKVSLLWDFLAESQIPRSSPLLFRVGYNF